MTADLKCAVCSRPSVGVASCSFGGFSLAYCHECVYHNAEPLSEFQALYAECGDEVAEWVRTVTTYAGGRYMTWDEWRGHDNQSGLV